MGSSEKVSLTVKSSSISVELSTRGNRGETNTPDPLLLLVGLRAVICSAFPHAAVMTVAVEAFPARAFRSFSISYGVLAPFGFALAALGAHPPLGLSQPLPL